MRDSLGLVSTCAQPLRQTGELLCGLFREHLAGFARLQPCRIVERLFDRYRGRVPPEADLVTYWFEKARAQVESGQTKRVGLVATNSIRGGANRRVLDRVVNEGGIFEAWSDEPWVIDGASVRVSLIGFGAPDNAPRLDGQPVLRINADLTAGDVDLTTAKGLKENRGVSFMGAGVTQLFSDALGLGVHKQDLAN
jgi:hypothetical protein